MTLACVKMSNCDKIIIFVTVILSRIFYSVIRVKSTSASIRSWPLLFQSHSVAVAGGRILSFLHCLCLDQCRPQLWWIKTAICCQCHTLSCTLSIHRQEHTSSISDVELPGEKENKQKATYHRVESYQNQEKSKKALEIFHL